MTEVGLWLSAVCCICFFLTKRDNQRFLQRKWSVNKIEEILFTSSCLNCWRHFWWMLSKKMAQKITLRHKMSQRKYWQMGTQSFRESRSKAEEHDLLFVHYWFWKATYWLFFLQATLLQAVTLTLGKPGNSMKCHCKLYFCQLSRTLHS